MLIHFLKHLKKCNTCGARNIKMIDKFILLRQMLLPTQLYKIKWFNTVNPTSSTPATDFRYIKISRLEMMEKYPLPSLIVNRRYRKLTL